MSFMYICDIYMHVFIDLFILCMHVYVHMHIHICIHHDSRNCRNGRLAAEIMAVITAKVNSPLALGSGLPLEGIDKLSFKWNKS